MLRKGDVIEILMDFDTDMLDHHVGQLYRIEERTDNMIRMKKVSISDSYTNNRMYYHGGEDYGGNKSRRRFESGINKGQFKIVRRET